MSDERPSCEAGDQDHRDSLRERLASELGTCVSSDLHAHMTRDVVLVVAPELLLLEVAAAVAVDDSTEVRGWIRAEQLRKPNLQEFFTWSQENSLPFRIVIVRPYVLVQALSQS